MLKCAVQVMRWRDTRAHRPAICTRNRCTHYVQFNEQPLLAEASHYPRPKFYHTPTHIQRNGVYVALQLFLVILVSDQWCRVLIVNTLLLSTGALGSFTCSGMTLPIYMGPTTLRGIRATGDTLSNVESQVFTPYKFGSTAGDISIYTCIIAFLLWNSKNLLPCIPVCLLWCGLTFVQSDHTRYIYWIKITYPHTCLKIIVLNVLYKMELGYKYSNPRVNCATNYLTMDYCTYIIQYVYVVMSTIWSVWPWGRGCVYFYVRAICPPAIQAPVMTTSYL